MCSAGGCWWSGKRRIIDSLFPTSLYLKLCLPPPPPSHGLLSLAARALLAAFAAMVLVVRCPVWGRVGVRSRNLLPSPACCAAGVAA